jgi:hypothetical protein
LLPLANAAKNGLQSTSRLLGTCRAPVDDAAVDVGDAGKPGTTSKSSISAGVKGLSDEELDQAIATLRAMMDARAGESAKLIEGEAGGRTHPAAVGRHARWGARWPTVPADERK